MDKLDLLEKYLSEELNPQEQISFDQLMKDDAEFREEAQLAVVLNANRRIEQKLHFKKLLAERQTETTPVKEAPVRQLPLRRLRSIAAVLLLGLTMAAGWLMFGQSNVNDLVAEGLSQKYTAPVTVRSGEVTDPNWKNAIQAYKDGNYTTAIAALERSIEKDITNAEEKHFYLGLCYLYQREANHEKAIDHLTKSKQINPNRYAQQANWFISLALLNLQKEEEAKVLLEEMVADEGYKSAEAAELLKEL